MQFDWDLYLWGWVTCLVSLAFIWPVAGALFWIMFDALEEIIERIE